MIAHYIINMLMQAPKFTKEEVRKWDEDFHIGDCFSDYDTLWDRHPFSLQSMDAEIKGEYIINPKDTNDIKHVAIISHGLSAMRDACIKYAKIFYDLGYNVVIYDQRYFGASTGPYCTMSQREATDLRKVISFSKEIFGQDMIYALHGESMGAATVLNVLDKETPEYVVADCPFSDLGRLIDELSFKKAWILGKPAAKKARKIGIKRYDFDFRAVRPIDSIKVTNVPILFMHGKKDSLINCKHSEDMLSVCKNPLSRIKIFDNAEHARSYASDREAYKEEMISFIKDVENSQ